MSVDPVTFLRETAPFSALPDALFDDLTDLPAVLAALGLPAP